MFRPLLVKTKVQTQGQIALVCTCCEAPAVQRIVRRTTWLCLLSRPLAALRRAHVLHCTLCGSASMLANREADRLVRTLRTAAPALADLDVTHEQLSAQDH